MVLGGIDLAGGRVIRCDADRLHYARGGHAPRLDTSVHHYASGMAGVGASDAGCGSPGAPIPSGTIAPLLDVVGASCSLRHAVLCFRPLECRGGGVAQSMGGIEMPSEHLAAPAAVEAHDIIMVN